MANGKLTPLSSPSVSLLEISRLWRILCRATTYPNHDTQGWSEKEVATADVVIAALTHLQRIGCTDIEKLLRDTLERHRRQAL